jgi:hypothetical protein
VLAVTPPDFVAFATYGTELTFNTEVRVDFNPGAQATPLADYAASRAIAYSTVNTFILEEQPNFSIIQILQAPAIVRSVLVTEGEQALAERMYLAPILGKDGSNMGCPFIGAAIHVEDAARVLVDFLHPRFKGCGVFGASVPVVWNESIAITQKWFPEAWAAGTLTEGDQQTKSFRFDDNGTERLLGLTFWTYETMVKEAVEQYLGWLKEEKERQESEGQMWGAEAAMELWNRDAKDNAKEVFEEDEKVAAEGNRYEENVEGEGNDSSWVLTHSDGEGGDEEEKAFATGRE